jgi:hypothetical protein
MDLEAIALSRAEEQMRDRWVEPDSDEGSGEAPEPRVCVVCETAVARSGHTWPRLCPECRAAGWTASLCPSCGRHIRRTDQTGPSKERRGYCRPCRDEWEVISPRVDVSGRRRSRFGFFISEEAGT